MEPIRYRTLSETDFVDLLRPIVPERIWEESRARATRTSATRCPGSRVSG